MPWPCLLDAGSLSPDRLVLEGCVSLPADVPKTPASAVIPSVALPALPRRRDDLSLSPSPSSMQINT